MPRRVMMLAIVVAAACQNSGARTAGSVSGRCGPALAVPASGSRPEAVIAAPERTSGSVAVGEHYLAQQTGTSVLVWDLVTGRPTSITRDVQLRGIEPDADRFLVERDHAVVALEPSGRVGALIAERPIDTLRAVPGGGPVRYAGVFHETSEDAVQVWTDAHGTVEDFRFFIGCPGFPILAHPYTDNLLAISPRGRAAATTTSLYNLSCNRLPPRIVTWSLAHPTELGRTVTLPKALAGAAVAAIADDGRLVALLDGKGRVQLVQLAETGDSMAIVGSLGDDEFSRVELVGALVVTSSAERTQGWDAATRKLVWTHRGALFGPPLPDGKLVIADAKDLAVVGAGGKNLWQRHSIGAVQASRAGTWIVAADAGGLVVFDAASGRIAYKLASVPLRAPRALAFVDSGLVASDGSTLTFWSRGALAARVPYAATAIARGSDGRLVTSIEERCADDSGQRIETWTGTTPPPVPAEPRCANQLIDPGSARVMTATPTATDTTTYQIVGTPPVTLASVEPGPSDVMLSRDGRRALGYFASEAGSDNDGTSVITWDAASGEVLARSRAALTSAERRALFRGSIATSGFVSATIEGAALSPDGAFAATAYRYVHMDKLNWSYETLEGEAHRITVRRTDTGERAFPDLDGGPVLGYLQPDLLVVAQGRTLRLFRGPERVAETTFLGAEATSIAWTADGTVIATGHADGVIRLWSADGLGLRATLLDYTDDEWLAMTPGGAYTGTPEVGERVSWAYDAPLEPFGFEQFAARLQRPDIVAARVATGAGDLEPPHARPPHVELVSAPGKTSDEAITVRVAVRSPTRVDEVRFYVEGKPIATATPCGDAELEARIPIAPGPNRITVVAFDDRGLVSNPLAVDVTRTSAGARPDLWIVAVGVNRYRNLSADAQLGFAVADARSLASAFHAQAGTGRPFDHAHVTVLEDDRATPESIEHAIDGLADMKADDVAVVFLAGHGVKSGDHGDMVFLTGDAQAPGGKLADAHGSVSWSDLGTRIERVKGRVLVLVDACHAGHLDQELLTPNDDLARRLASSGRAGVVVFAAAKGRQFSFETHGVRGLMLVKDLPAFADAQDGHGLFTAALLKSLEDPETDRNGDGALQLSELVDEVTWRVRRTTSDQQTPWIVRRELFGDFVIGAVRRP